MTLSGSRKKRETEAAGRATPKASIGDRRSASGAFPPIDSAGAEIPGD